MMSEENNEHEEATNTAEENTQATENETVETKESTAEEKYTELNDKYLRLYSEFDNYRKRTSKERIELFSTASQDVIKALLPVLDDFDRAKEITERNVDRVSHLSTLIQEEKEAKEKRNNLTGFMNDMDQESIEMGGEGSFFVGDYKQYSWDNLFDTKLSGGDRVSLYSSAIEGMYLNPNAPERLRVSAWRQVQQIQYHAPHPSE